MNYLLNKQTDAGACLAVVECGAEQGTGPTHDGVVGACARATVVQQNDETPAELALRATRRALRLTKSGPLEAGVIVASDTVNDEVFLCRCQIARAMILAMRGAVAPRLIFVAPSSISEAGRHELFSIAGTLSTQLHGTPIEVSVRFMEARPISALHSVVTAITPRPALTPPGSSANELSAAEVA
ncbi:MAG TPA: hypothetical protein VK524_28650 [Polyangiaceae bacterium]|nr:hypothetical protein [Polyangiaceae bacterium]